VNRFLGFLHEGWSLPRDIIIRLPIWFTMATSCIVVVTTLGMKEPESTPSPEEETRQEGLSMWRNLVRPFRQVFKAAVWTLSHRFVLFVIIAALALDSVARQFVVLGSQYYRIIEIPPVWFGFIGAGMALLGVIHARIARYMVSRHSPFFNYLALSAVLMAGLLGVMLVLPWAGVLFAVPVFAMMGLVAYQSSYYINREVDSAHRATVLSFRGLALNLGLGLASLLYMGLIASLKTGAAGGLSPEQLQESVFIDSLKAFPVYFLVLFVVILVLGKVFIRQTQLCFQVGDQ